MANNTKARQAMAQAQAEGATPEDVAKAAPEGEGTLTAADVATLAGVPAKDFRRWMRAQARAIGAGDTLPGKGRRYAYTPEQAAALAAAYGRTKASGTLAPATAILAALAPVAPEEEGAPRA